MERARLEVGCHDDRRRSARGARPTRPRSARRPPGGCRTRATTGSPSRRRRSRTSSAVAGRSSRRRSRERGSAALAPHLVGEAHQAVRPAVRRGHGDEAAAPRLAVDQPLLGQALDRVAGGHPADAELAAQSRVGGERVAGPEDRRCARGAPARSRGSAGGRSGHAVIRRPVAAPALRCGGLRRPLRSVDGGADRPGQRAQLGQPRRRPRRSSVIVTRRAISARIGSKSRSPAAATPPPMTTRSRRDHVIMLRSRSRGSGRRRRGRLGRARRLPAPRARPPRRSRSRTPPRSGRPGRRPRRSRGCRSRTTARPGRSSGGRARRPCRRGPGGRGRRSRCTPPTPVPSVRPTIDEAPRPAPRRSSARPNARASLMRNGGHADRAGDRARHRVAGPRPGHVRQEAGAPGGRVVEAGHADPDADDRAPRGDRVASPPPPAGPTTEAGTASGSATSRVGTCPWASSASRRRPSCSTTAHLRFVAPRSRPRWRVAAVRSSSAPPSAPRQDSAVTRVYAAATATMIEPKRIWRTASGKPRAESSDERTVRMSAPTIVPP